MVAVRGMPVAVVDVVGVVAVGDRLVSAPLRVVVPVVGVDDMCAGRTFVPMVTVAAVDVTVVEIVGVVTVEDRDVAAPLAVGVLVLGMGLMGVCHDGWCSFWLVASVVGMVD